MEIVAVGPGAPSGWARWRGPGRLDGLGRVDDARPPPSASRRRGPAAARGVRRGGERVMVYVLLWLLGIPLSLILLLFLLGIGR